MKNKENEERLLHMKNAIEKINKYTADIEFDAFEENEMLQDAIFKNLEIIGEAGYKITNNIKETYPNIAWRSIEGLRHKLVHDYYKVDLKIVWQTRSKSLPILLEDINRILADIE